MASRIGPHQPSAASNPAPAPPAASSGPVRQFRPPPPLNLAGLPAERPNIKVVSTRAPRNARPDSTATSRTGSHSEASLDSDMFALGAPSQLQRRPAVRRPATEQTQDAASILTASVTSEGGSESTWGTPPDMKGGIHGENVATPHPAQATEPPANAAYHQGPMGPQQRPEFRLDPKLAKRVEGGTIEHIRAARQSAAAPATIRKSKSLFGRLADSMKGKDVPKGE